MITLIAIYSRQISATMVLPVLQKDIVGDFSHHSLPDGVSIKKLSWKTLKIGYQTYSPEFVNAGIYASAHYKLDQFQVGVDDDHMANHRAQRVLVGATALLSLGSMGQASRVIIEAGCRYSLGLAYKSPLGTDKKQLNDGLVSHFAIKLASRGMMQNVGIYADINHFNLWKDFRPNQKLNNMTFGLTWTITPQQVDER